MSIEEDVLLILREIRKYNSDKFTGKMTISLNMSQGGIGQISINLEKNLKKSQKL